MSERNYILLYVGNENGDFEDILCADMVIRGMQVTIATSRREFDDVDEELFETCLTSVLNVAKVYSEDLHLKIRVDDTVIDAIEAFESHSARKNFKSLLKDVADVD